MYLWRRPKRAKNVGLSEVLTWFHYQEVGNFHQKIVQPIQPPWVFKKIPRTVAGENGHSENDSPQDIGQYNPHSDWSAINQQSFIKYTVSLKAICVMPYISWCAPHYQWYSTFFAGCNMLQLYLMVNPPNHKLQAFWNRLHHHQWISLRETIHQKPVICPLSMRLSA